MDSSAKIMATHLERLLYFIVMVGGRNGGFVQYNYFRHAKRRSEAWVDEDNVYVTDAYGRYHDFCKGEFWNLNAEVDMLIGPDNICDEHYICLPNVARKGVFPLVTGAALPLLTKTIPYPLLGSLSLQHSHLCCYSVLKHFLVLAN